MVVFFMFIICLVNMGAAVKVRKLNIKIPKNRVSTDVRNGNAHGSIPDRKIPNNGNAHGSIPDHRIKDSNEKKKQRTLFLEALAKHMEDEVQVKATRQLCSGNCRNVKVSGLSRKDSLWVMRRFYCSRLHRIGGKIECLVKLMVANEDREDSKKKGRQAILENYSRIVQIKFGYTFDTKKKKKRRRT